MSVRLGMIYVPVGDVLNLVVDFCSPLLLVNSSKEFPLSVAGSSFLISYRGRLIQLSTNHQLLNLDRQAQEIRLIETFPDRVIVPPIAASTPGVQIPELNNMGDLVFCQYRLQNGSSLARRFLKVWPEQFVPVPPPNLHNEFVYFFIGFPNQAVGYDTSVDGQALEHLRSRWIRLHLSPVTKSEFAIPNRIHFESLDAFTDVNIEPDGISGSPVFVVYQTTDRVCHIGFCGIITHANANGNCAVYDARAIKMILDAD
jgi:hypothetical protein